MTDEKVVLFRQRPKVSSGSPSVGNDSDRLERLGEHLRMAKAVHTIQWHALSHQEADKIRRAYHRASYWAERVTMAQRWSDELDCHRDGGKFVAFRSKGGGTA
jgi:hypothetical protein